MKRIRFAACALALSLVVAGCDDSPDTGTRMNDNAPAMAEGTSGIAEGTSGATDTSPIAAETQSEDTRGLPDTASPLPLAALLAALSLGGAAGLRYFGRS